MTAAPPGSIASIPRPTWTATCPSCGAIRAGAEIPSIEQLAEWLRTDGRDGLRRHVYTMESLSDTYTHEDGTTGDYPDADIESYRDSQCDFLARKLHALLVAASSSDSTSEVAS